MCPQWTWTRLFIGSTVCGSPGIYHYGNDAHHRTLCCREEQLLNVQPNTHTDLKTVLTKKVKTRVTSTAFLPGEFSSQVLQQCSMMNNFRIKDTQTKKPLSIL